jgi:GxxExxY protein
VEPSQEIDSVAREVIGAAIEVHRVLGPGFVESIYEEALCVELDHQKVPFARQVPVAIEYRSHAIGQARLDLLVADCLIVELKAVPQLLPLHMTQVISYLKAARQPLGLLINFHVAVLQSGVRRVVRTL